MTPTIPKKLSQTCQEFVSLLFDREQTKKPDIYTKLFSHEFLQMEFKTNQNLNDTNITISQGLGSALQRGHVVNLLNSNDNPTFSITLTANENSSFINSICINARRYDEMLDAINEEAMRLEKIQIDAESKKIRQEQHKVQILFCLISLYQFQV